jgi:uncharacterized Fe-S cluster-containing protein
MNTPIIHGENLLLPIDKMPEGKTQKHTTFIVGHSETGHHHILEATKGQEFDILVQDGEIYFTNTFEAKVTHKKLHDIHETVTVAPGIYKVNRKNEYDPFNKVIRSVWD